MSEVDIVLEKIACDLERPDLLDLMGVGAKRKRDREDAALRRKTRQDQRRELATWVRSFKSDGGNNRKLKFLEAVRDADDCQWAWGPEVAAAIVGGLVTVRVEIEFSSHLANTGHRFRFALTKAGEAILSPPTRDPEA